MITAYTFLYIYVIVCGKLFYSVSVSFYYYFSFMHDPNVFSFPVVQATMALMQSL